MVRCLGIQMIKSWLFYKKLWFVIFLLPIGVQEYKELEGELQEKKQAEFLLQFKDMIQSLSSSLSAGYSVENAVRETQKEMNILYPKDAMIQEELTVMVRQMRVQIPMEQVLDEFSKRVNLEDVKSFATVFGTAKRSGGNVIDIIKTSVGQIGGKIDVKREVRTILAAKTYEFRVMSVIPFVMIAYMQISFPEFMECLYENMIGTGVMTICLIIYEGAYLFGRKLIKISV